MKAYFACLFLCFGLTWLGCGDDGTHQLDPRVGYGGSAGDSRGGYGLEGWDPFAAGGYTPGVEPDSTSGSGGDNLPDNPCQGHGKHNGKGHGKGHGHGKDCE